MIDPAKIDPTHAEAKVSDLDAQIHSLQDQVKTLKKKRDIYAAALKKK